LKTAKSPYLSNRSTEFNEIWHGDASWPTTRDRPITFRIFENPRWRRPPSSKSLKIAISQQQIDQFSHNLACWCKIGLLIVQTVKKFEFAKIQDGGRPPFWKPLDRHISATV